jgi:hypothetical protein
MQAEQWLQIAEGAFRGYFVPHLPLCKELHSKRLILQKESTHQLLEAVDFGLPAFLECIPFSIAILNLIQCFHTRPYHSLLYLPNMGCIKSALLGPR